MAAYSLCRGRVVRAGVIILWYWMAVVLIAGLIIMAMGAGILRAAEDEDGVQKLAAVGSSKAAKCQPSGYLPGTSHGCNRGGYSDCCEAGKSYPQYECSPPVGHRTKATLTLNCFEKGGCGGAPSECDNAYHSDDDPVVALSTGWYDGGSRCGNRITIHGNGRSTHAVVVDECDSVHGCDAEHNYEPPCPNDVVDASPAVWRALGIHSGDPNYGGLDVTWSAD